MILYYILDDTLHVVAGILSSIEFFFTKILIGNHLMSHYCSMEYLTTRPVISMHHRDNILIQVKKIQLHTCFGMKKDWTCQAGNKNSNKNNVVFRREKC
jgi:hypothetical protein